MSSIFIRSRQHISRSASIYLRQQTRYLSIAKPCFEQPNKQRAEILSDERLQQIVALIEKPLHKKAVSIGDTHNVLLESVETFRPKHDVIWVSKMEKLRLHLHNSFTVRQLTQFLAAHQLPRKGLKKQQLISAVIEQHWGIKTDEQVREEELQKRMNRIKEIFPASRQELFFIIGDNGNTIRAIEKKNDVNITIDVSEGAYIVEGSPEAVGAAKKEILSHLTISEETVDLPAKVVENPEVLHEIEVALSDVSRTAGAYISLTDDKLVLSSISNESMQNAKRLISLMLAELNISHQHKTTYAVVHDVSEFTILPFYDTNAMSLYDRKLDWSRVKSKKVEIDNYKLLSNPEEKVGSFDKLNQLLLEPFNKDQLNDISMEARFGHLLFRKGQESKTSTNDILELYKNRTMFFNTIPPPHLTTPFIPLTLDGGFHERSVQLEYINQSLLSLDNDPAALKGLQVEFVITEDGEMKLKHIIEELDRSTIDILGVYGNVDIRLLAKQFRHASEDDQRELIDQCNLTSYSEFNAPKLHVANKSNLVLSDITFVNKKRYLYEDTLISVNHVEQQEKRAKRTELTVTSVNPETLDLAGSNSRWPSFSNILTGIAQKWDYSN